MNVRRFDKESECSQADKSPLTMASNSQAVTISSSKQKSVTASKHTSFLDYVTEKTVPNVFEEKKKTPISL